MVSPPPKPSASKSSLRRRAKSRGWVGSTIQRRYHIVRLLGDGGMGAVYKAADQVLRRFVAIKMLHPETVDNPSAVERFVREARSAAAIGHPNIIDILDFGYEGERPFLVMEYLRGRSLGEAIADEGRLSMGRACNIATHALAGLAAAHDRGILHRDLKPANLMLIALLGDRDFVKLCDFGFAALVQPSMRIDGGKNLTPARTLVGTPAYAAPERLVGDDRRDRRMDVYAIGVVLFEMLVGRRPFDASSFRELARKVKNDPPPSLHVIDASIPVGLDQVVQRALAKKREDRWNDAESFAAALVPFGGRLLPVTDDCPSDSFTMDLLRLRARETQQQRAMSHSEADELLAFRRQQRAKLSKKKRPEPQSAADEREHREAAFESVSIPIEVDASAEAVGDGTTKAWAGSESSARRGSQAAPIFGPFDHAKTEADVRRFRNPNTFGAEVADSLTEAARFAAVHTGSVEAPLAARDQAAIARVGLDDRGILSDLSLSVIRFVSRRFGERALTDLLSALPDSAREVFSAGIAEGEWVTYGAHDALVAAVDARLGRDDLHLVVQCGRAGAEGCFERMRQLRPPSPPPEVLLAQAPRLFSELTRGIEVHVPRVGRGYGRVEMREAGEPSLTFGVFLIGFLDRALDRFGAKEAEVNLISSPALGDPDCVYEVSWIS